MVSTSMGAPGTDVKLSPAALKVLPVAIEAKHVEKLNVFAAYDQASANAGKYHPIVVMKKNRTKPLVVVSLDYFLQVHAECDKLAKLVVGKSK